MRNIIGFITIALVAAFSFGTTNIAQAQDYTAIYDARCPTSRFPFGNNNVNATHNVSKRYSEFTITTNMSFPQNRSNNNIEAFQVAWRHISAHSLERRNFTDLGAAFLGLKKRGLGTLNASVDLVINPSKMNKGTYFFYFEGITRDGEYNRYVAKINIT